MLLCVFACSWQVKLYLLVILEENTLKWRRLDKGKGQSCKSLLAGTFEVLCRHDSIAACCMVLWCC